MTQRKINVERHLGNLHSALPEPPVCCEIKFETRFDAMVHRKRFHKDGMIHECPLCDKSFPRPALVLRHISVHTGEKRFKCPECGYASNHRYNFLRHCRVRHGLRYKDRKQRRLPEGSTETCSAERRRHREQNNDTTRAHSHPQAPAVGRPSVDKNEEAQVCHPPNGLAVPLHPAEVVAPVEDVESATSDTNHEQARQEAAWVLANFADYVLGIYLEIN